MTGHSPSGPGHQPTASAAVPASSRSDVPNAAALSSVLALSPEWQELDVDEPREAWESFYERLRRAMAGHQRISAQLRKDAADATEMADEHDSRAEELWHLMAAMNRAPIAWPAQGGEAGTAETAETGSVHEHPVLEEDASNPNPELEKTLDHQPAAGRNR